MQFCRKIGSDNKLYRSSWCHLAMKINIHFVDVMQTGIMIVWCFRLWFYNFRNYYQPWNYRHTITRYAYPRLCDISIGESPNNFDKTHISEYYRKCRKMNILPPNYIPFPVSLTIFGKTVYWDALLLHPSIYHFSVRIVVLNQGWTYELFQEVKAN